MSVIYLSQRGCISPSDLEAHLGLSQFEDIRREHGRGSVASRTLDRTDICASAALLCGPFALVLLVWCLLPQAPGVLELSAIDPMIETWN